jgi:hypothetical protein
VHLPIIVFFPLKIRPRYIIVCTIIVSQVKEFVATHQLNQGVHGVDQDEPFTTCATMNGGSYKGTLYHQP